MRVCNVYHEIDVSCNTKEGNFQKTWRKLSRHFQWNRRLVACQLASFLYSYLFLDSSIWRVSSSLLQISRAHDKQSVVTLKVTTFIFLPGWFQCLNDGIHACLNIAYHHLIFLTSLKACRDVSVNSLYFQGFDLKFNTQLLLLVLFNSDPVLITHHTKSISFNGQICFLFYDVYWKLGKIILPSSFQSLASKGQKGATIDLFPMLQCNTHRISFIDILTLRWRTVK